jgi:hypothetical protein
VSAEDAFQRLEELASVPAKKRYDKPRSPEQKARDLESKRKWRTENPEKSREQNRKWRAENPEKAREQFQRWNEKKTIDPELFAINQAEIYARNGIATRDITANCHEPTRSKLQALVDRIKADPSAGKRVVGLLRNMRELRKLELAEMKQATETETEN